MLERRLSISANAFWVLKASGLECRRLANRSENGLENEVPEMGRLPDLEFALLENDGTIKSKVVIRIEDREECCGNSDVADVDCIETSDTPD